jgi:hypothetical protein
VESKSKLFSHALSTQQGNSNSFRGQTLLSFEIPGTGMPAVMFLLLVAILTSSLAVTVAVPFEGMSGLHFNGASPGEGNENTTYSSKTAPSHKSAESHSATADVSGPAAVGTIFNGVCRQVSLGGLGQIGGTTLSAQCVDGAGQWWDTSLNLNHCMENEGGRLVYKEQ